MPGDSFPSCSCALIPGCLPWPLPHAVALLCVQLELANMWKNGDIQDMWAVANQTHLTFNMVRRGGSETVAGVGSLLAAWLIRQGRTAWSLQTGGYGSMCL